MLIISKKTVPFQEAFSTSKLHIRISISSFFFLLKKVSRIFSHKNRRFLNHIGNGVFFSIYCITYTCMGILLKKYDCKSFNKQIVHVKIDYEDNKTFNQGYFNSVGVDTKFEFLRFRSMAIHVISLLFSRTE